MCELLVWSIGEVQWLEIIKALAPVTTALIAFVALKNWRRQDKAKREVEFLDSLLEAMHAYMVEMHKPVVMLRFIKAGMESHVRDWESKDQELAAINGAIEYIKKAGEQDGKRLLELLEAVQPPMIKFNGAIGKGQVFNFPDYMRCYIAGAALTSHAKKLEALTAFIAMPSWNWDNREILKRLKEIVAMDPDAMSNDIDTNNVVILEFVKATYSRLYG